MKTVGLIGGYDKSDLILYMAKILTMSEKKVLVVDTTVCRKLQYIVPAIKPTKSYITEFEGFDVAVGFKNFDEITKYLGTDMKSLPYDLAIVDIDSVEATKEFEIEKNYKNCFVTAFDLYSLKRGMEILSTLEKPVKMSKVLFSQNFLKEENEYLDYLSLGYKVSWESEIFTFPIEVGTYSVMIENQIISRITIKKLSAQFKNNLSYFISMIFNDDVNEGQVKKAMRNIEKD